MSVSDRAAVCTGWSAAGIARHVRGGDVSAAEVLEAHLARLEEVNPRINALVARRFDQARREAAAIDATRARGQSLGPLAGVPMTVKECFAVAGLPTTVGLLHRVGQIDTADSPLVARLKAAGAVIVGKTNVPQLMIFHETNNPVYGLTRHPERDDRSPGGSSGGEAAIIAAGGVPLGLGSDIGGSIRQPCHSCGIAGLLPTRDRLTTAGCFDTFPGLTSMRFQPGPMARSVADLALSMRVMSDADTEPGPRASPPIPVGNPDEVSLAGLRVAVWDDDRYFTPSPANRRAVSEAAAALARRGATVEPFEPPDMTEAMRLYLGLISADGGAGLYRLLSHDQPDERIARLVLLRHLPRWLRPTACRWLRARGQRYFAELLSTMGRRSADELWRLTTAQMQYIERFLSALESCRFVAMLCPVHGVPALKHGDSAWLLPAASYCLLMNLLGLPAGAVPVTRVREDEESDRASSRDPAIRTAINTERDSGGLPIGVQLAAIPWREDIVLALMAAIEAETVSSPS